MSGMVDLFAVLTCLAVGGLLGYLIALVRRSPMGEETAQLRSQVAALDATLAAERAGKKKRLPLLADPRNGMTHQFRALANDILEEKPRRFTEQNQTNLGQLLDPL